jgi:hypothetical protein
MAVDGGDPQHSPGVDDGRDGQVQQAAAVDVPQGRRLLRHAAARS